MRYSTQVAKADLAGARARNGRDRFPLSADDRKEVIAIAGERARATWGEPPQGFTLSSFEEYTPNDVFAAKVELWWEWDA